MTDWSCARCRLTVRRYRHTGVTCCPSCGRDMARGRRRGYRTDRRHQARLANESPAERHRRHLDARRPER